MCQASLWPVNGHRHGDKVDKSIALLLKEVLYYVADWSVAISNVFLSPREADQAAFSQRAVCRGGLRCLLALLHAMRPPSSSRVQCGVWEGVGLD